MDYVQPLLANAKHIVVCTGAGVSTNSGIPDYRTSQQRPWTRQDVGTAEWDAFVARAAAAEPSAVHHWCVQLHAEGRLVRVYTQNVDGLHQRAGLRAEKLVEAHGSLATGVVFDGEPMPDAFDTALRDDFSRVVDAVVVLGTSLTKLPFCAVPNLAPASALRVLVDRDLSVFVRACTRRRYALQGLESVCFCSAVKLAGRLVTNKPTWLDTREQQQRPGLHVTKWKQQYMLEMDCDAFVNAL
jgi:NAD-dependent SIR2 family protein deacetylase